MSKRIVLILSGVALVGVCLLPLVRWFALGWVQEGMPLRLTWAALRLSTSKELVVDLATEPPAYLAVAAMEHSSGDWPIRKFLEKKGLTAVDQLGAMMIYRKPDGHNARYVTRMFTRQFMVVRAEK